MSLHTNSLPRAFLFKGEIRVFCGSHVRNTLGRFRWWRLIHVLSHDSKKLMFFRMVFPCNSSHQRKKQRGMQRYMTNPWDHDESMGPTTYIYLLIDPMKINHSFFQGGPLEMAENKWGTGFTTPISGDTTLLISGRNPPCRSTNPILLVPAMTRTNSKGKVLQNDMETKKNRLEHLGVSNQKLLM